ncbi:hypothetical protein BDK51DRAFT_16211 [Blyttiomyces helicus]|uniref:C2H2-type domain-containing protein n=1 Tax=Blyttiomyces helicus TaxID=388810 RepID=A0A4P9WAI3_9FUNG|nr:hypothetical protein BDK51DRAFT_16211 [Blyttiomyces helicus]|eukprot:RKO87870.1 hypothetical protein BDK51DRAFT_16211 [Blyttiomyces helicus]
MGNWATGQLRRRRLSADDDCYCRDCNCSFRRSEDKDRHDVAFCQLCKRGFQHLDDKDEHDETFCHDCDRCFRRPQDKDQHDAAIHYENECPHCGSTLPTQGDLKRQVEDYHDWHCPMSSCDRAFWSEDGMDQQVEEEHTRTCRECEREFDSEEALDLHWATGVHSEEAWECPDCDRKFPLPSSLAAHIESGDCSSEHGRVAMKRYIYGTRERNLGLRGTIFSSYYDRYSTSNVPQHMTSDSWNGRGYECCICDDSFSRLGSLNGHLVIHEPKDYHCIHCERRFGVMNGLLAYWEKSLCGAAVETVQSFSCGMFFGSREA